ncbi:MAG: hypothetical protein K6F35_10460, partial [Lachnospiraceae bacterium]|nr:hypothetical protein [Lachnospiraceae bacterium]
MDEQEGEEQMGSRFLRRKRWMAATLCLSLLFGMQTGITASAQTGAVAAQVETAPEAFDAAGAVEAAETQEAAPEVQKSAEGSAGDLKDAAPGAVPAIEEKPALPEAVSKDQAGIDLVPETEAASGDADEVVPVGEGAPKGWFATQTEGGAVKWSQDGEGNYIATFSHEGEIYYDWHQNDNMPDPGCSVTISADTASPSFNVAVAGGWHGRPTTVSVDASLSEKVFVNELTVLEDGEGKYSFIGFDKKENEVIDEDTYEIKMSETAYVPGTKVYDGLEMYCDNYLGNYYIDYSDRCLTNPYEQEGYYSPIKAYSVSGDVLLSSEGGKRLDLSPLADRALGGPADFIIETGNRKYWLPVGTTGADPATLEDRSLSLDASKEGVVYAYETSDPEKKTAAGRKNVQYELRNTLGERSQAYRSLRWKDSRNLYGDYASLFIYTYGLNGNKNNSRYYSYKRDGEKVYRSIYRSAFTSVRKEITEKVYIQPKYGDAWYGDDQMLGISGNGTQFELTYRYGTWGYASLHFAAVKSGVSGSSIPAELWQVGEQVEHPEGARYHAVLNRAVNENGEADSIKDGQVYDIYGIYKDEHNHMTGKPFIVYTIKSGDYDRKR